MPLTKYKYGDTTHRHLWDIELIFTRLNEIDALVDSRNFTKADRLFTKLRGEIEDFLNDSDSQNRAMDE